MRRFSYLRDPAAIYRLSFERAREACDLSHLPAELHAVALRLVHASARPELVHRLSWHGRPVSAARRALAAGAPILCDVRAVAVGIRRGGLPAANSVICHIADPEVAEEATRRRITRAMAAVERWGDRVQGAVVVIGNAPTALFRLLERIVGEGLRPASILAFPVGFVGAAESKEALLDVAREIGLDVLALRGTDGGAALAAAAVNALFAGGEG